MKENTQDNSALFYEVGAIVKVATEKKLSDYKKREGK